MFEAAPIGTKATLNEAFDRAMREMNSCFAQLESDLDWLDFDPVRLVFETVADVPQNGSRPAQYAVLHLLCPQHKHSLHFSVHITRRNRHSPRFVESDYRFYAPVNLPIGAEIGRVQVQDQDPIIYNSQVQLSIVRSSDTASRLANPPPKSGAAGELANGAAAGAAVDDPHWEMAKNGSILTRRRLTELKLFKPYQLRLLAVDFGSPQLFSLANVTIVPVSVSQPQFVRVNVANHRYQVFQWELPSYGVPERFRLVLKRKGEQRALHEQQMPPTETMAMTKIRLPLGIQLEVFVAAVDLDGETPSEPATFQAMDTDLHCPGQCSPDAGTPMCHYSHSQQLEQYRDPIGQLHCLCFAGFSGPECDRVEHCPAERLLEAYGGVDWPETPVNQSTQIPCPYNEDGRRLQRQCGWNAQREQAQWANATNADHQQQQQTSRSGGGSKGANGQQRRREQQHEEKQQQQQMEGHCRTQSSVLVHLGVLANYGRRSEQTLSGLQSVMRFLGTLLQFPAFQPAVKSAHFDAKIAEHVAQVLDSMSARNLSALAGGGNSTQLSTQLVEYAREFVTRLPMPFTLQSSTGGLQMRAWEMLPSSSGGGAFLPASSSSAFDAAASSSSPAIARHARLMDVDDPIADNSQSGVHLGPCFVQPSAHRGRALHARAICLRNATLFPLLAGHSPVLMLKLGEAIGNGEEEEQQRKQSGNEMPPQMMRIKGTRRGNGAEMAMHEEEEQGKQRKTTTAAAGMDGPLVLGFRLPATMATQQKQQENFTCAQFDEQTQHWSITGISLLSREMRPHGQILLCEVNAASIYADSVFALLPESLFVVESWLSWSWMTKFAPPLVALITIGICLLLLLWTAFLDRHSDPAQLVLLLALLLLHLFHLLLLLRPHQSALPFGGNFFTWPSSSALFSTLQLALLSFSATLALLNSSIYTRIVQLELEDVRKGPSRSARLICTLLFAILLPLALCVLTALMDGQILAGLDSEQPQLQPYNWTFGLALLFPLVLFMGCSMGFGAYSLWYGNKLATHMASNAASDWPSLESSTSLLQRRLLHQLSSAGGLSWLVLLFPFANLLVLLQPAEPIRSLVLCVLYACTALTVFLFLRLLSRIQRRLPHAHTNAIGQGPRSGRGGGGGDNTLVASLDENCGARNGGGGFFAGQKPPLPPPTAASMLIVQQQGQAQPIGPPGGVMSSSLLLLDPNNNNNANCSTSSNNNSSTSPMSDYQDRQYLLLRRSIHQQQQQQPQQCQSSSTATVQLSIGSSSNGAGGGGGGGRPSFYHQQQQRRLSDTVSTSAGTVLLESEDLALSISVDRCNQSTTSQGGRNTFGGGLQQQQRQQQQGMPPNLFAEMDAFDEQDDDDGDEEEEDLNAFLDTDATAAATTLMMVNNNGGSQMIRQQQTTASMAAFDDGTTTTARRRSQLNSSRQTPGQQQQQQQSPPSPSTSNNNNLTHPLVSVV